MTFECARNGGAGGIQIKVQKRDEDGATGLRVKTRSITLLVFAEIMAMSLWFVSSAVLPDMVQETAISPFRQAMLASGVQAGFVVGALVSAISGISDRYDPRRVFMISAIIAAIANLALLVLPIGGAGAILMRFLT